MTAAISNETGSDWNEAEVPFVFHTQEGTGKMIVKRDGQIIESAQEARQAERGPTVRIVLVASTLLAVVALLAIWLVFFRT